MEKSTVVFQDPWKRHVTFKAYKDFETVDLPAGQSALGFLGIQLDGLPKAAYPRKGDAEDNESTAVIRIDGLSSNEPLPIASSLTVNGKNPTPGVIVIDDRILLFLLLFLLLLHVTARHSTAQHSTAFFVFFLFFFY